MGITQKNLGVRGARRKALFYQAVAGPKGSFFYMDNGGGTHQESPPNWSEYDARGVAEEDLTWLPDATRALVEECRAQSKQPNGGAAGSPAEALPYTRRLYEKAVPGEEDLLQLQWMRIDVREAR